jgi:hypothetical protein
MSWRSNLKLSNFSSVFVVLRCRPVLVMFVWRKDQIDLTQLMGLKLWHLEWDLCDYLVRTQNRKLDHNDARISMSVVLCVVL